LRDEERKEEMNNKVVVWAGERGRDSTSGRSGHIKGRGKRRGEKVDLLNTSFYMRALSNDILSFNFGQVMVKESGHANLFEGFILSRFHSSSDFQSLYCNSMLF